MKVWVEGSVAIARALNDIYNLNAEYQGRAARLISKNNCIGNTFVYRLLCEAAQKLKVGKYES